MTSNFALAAVAAACLASSAYAADPVAPPAVDDTNVLVVPTLAAPAKPAAKERIICRTEYEIGSFVKGTRRCGTASEWRASSRAAQDTTARIQDQKGMLQGH